jgi:GT2 family glycosyltransferase
MDHHPTPEASVIVVSFNTREVLQACLTQLYAAIGQRDIEVIVVDNASRDGSADRVAAAFPQVRLLRSPVNLGFAAANNLGFREASGRYLILLNPDALVAADTLERAIRQMEAQPQVGLAGGRLLGPDGADQPSARLFPSLLNEFLVLSGLAARFPRSRLCGRFDRTWADPAVAAEVDWVPGAFSILRHELVTELGGFDERFFLYYEEVDLCRRLRARGWKIGYWPDLVVRHTGGESSKTLEHLEISSSGSQLVLWRMRSGLLYYRKHHGAPGAAGVALLESGWHVLRGWRARLSGDRAKAAESGRIVATLGQAWRETAGGRQSPARPW